VEVASHAAVAVSVTGSRTDLLPEIGHEVQLARADIATRPTLCGL